MTFHSLSSVPHLSFNDIVSIYERKDKISTVDRYELRQTNPTCRLVLLLKRAGGRYGPKTEGLSQCSQCQTDFTVEVPREEKNVASLYVNISFTNRGHSEFSKKVLALARKW